MALLSNIRLYLGLGSTILASEDLRDGAVELEILILSIFCYKRGEYKGPPTMKSKHEEDEDVEMRETEQVETDVLVDDFKDLELEVMASSREKTLWWMKDYD